MSTREDREHDAEIDARTACHQCAAEGWSTTLAECDGHDEWAPDDMDEL